MKLSAAIATRGRPDVLRATLESLAACDPQPHETIVVDGDESRSAEPVVRAFEDRPGAPLRYLSSPPGLTRQRNVALEHAAGDVIVFLDDDVEVDRDLFRVLEQGYADAGVVGVTGKVIEDSGRRFGNKRSAMRRLLAGRAREGTMSSFGYPRRLQDVDAEHDVEFMQGCLMSARLDQAVPLGFDEELPGYGLAEDEDFSYRLSRVGRIRYLPGAVVLHKNEGFRGARLREFNRSVVVNRAYLFRKNFPDRTFLDRVKFAGLILVLAAHRVVNREWPGVRGLAEGAVAAWRTRR